MSRSSNLSKVADTAAPLEFIRKTGFYVVGNEIYNHKVDALEAGTRKSLPVTWNFNYEVLNNVDWKTPVDINLLELYRMRAQQLRDQYDYLVLLYSGGADSDTILDSFLKNGIHLDEILYEGPFANMVGKYTPTTNTDPSNLLSEWEFSAKPKLDWVSKNFPQTKITLMDATDVLTEEDYDDTCTVVLAHHYVIIKRHRKFDAHVRELSKIHKKVAMLPGIDKPLLTVINNVMCKIFDDNVCSLKSDYIADFDRKVEYFYWTPDLPEIMVKQAQIIYQAVLANPSLRVFFDPEMSTLEQRKTQQHRKARRDLVSELIYPGWDLRTFQATKSESQVDSLHYRWATQIKDRAIESWRSSVTSRVNTIDKKHLNIVDGMLQNYKTIYQRRPFPIGVLPSLDNRK